MSWHILSWIGIGILGLGAILSFREHTWLRAANTAPGKVIELIQHRGPKGRLSYDPRVRYTTPDGASREFTRGYGTSPAHFSKGQLVQVAYDPKTSQACILTFGERYGFATFLIVIGAACIALAAIFTLGPIFVPKIYLN